MAEAQAQIVELPLEGAGARLRRARESAGLSRSDIAATTKISERYLASIEEGNFAALASSTYAVGFARSYARAVGLDENVIARAVRDELGAMDGGEERRAAATFAPGDLARIPSARIAWIAALGALAVVVAGMFLWRSYYLPAGSLPDLVTDQPATGAPAKAPPPAAPPQAVQAPVVFTALAPGVWVKFYDASGNQLLQKLMTRGESYTVPPGAAGPMIWTDRPDALQVTVNGQTVPRLSDKQVTVKDVPVTAAALLARPTTPRAAPAAAHGARASADGTRAAAGRAVDAPSPRPVAVDRGSAVRAAAPAPLASAPAAPLAPAAIPAPQPSTVSE